MVFDPRKKKPGILKRDEHNLVVKDEAQKTVEDLTRKLITTERDFQKDLTYSGHKGMRRDIVVFVTVVQRNSIDGKICLEDTRNPKFESWSPRDPYKYRVYDIVEAPIMVKEQPMSKGTLFKQMTGVMGTVMAYIMKMGAVSG
jgi:hypothetical protein